MGNYLNIGNAGFVSARKGTYVDKTGMISFINRTLGTADKLTCVSRPRRFGKSFAAKMLCAYYDKSCDSRELFDGLEISGDASFEKCLNKYKSRHYLPSIIASDDIEEAQFTKPMLTTVRLPRNEMGKFALFMLLDRMRGGHESVVKMELEGKLMIRSSCYPLESSSNSPAV